VVQLRLLVTELSKLVVKTIKSIVVFTINIIQQVLILISENLLLKKNQQQQQSPGEFQFTIGPLWSMFVHSNHRSKTLLNRMAFLLLLRQTSLCDSFCYKPGKCFHHPTLRSTQTQGTYQNSAGNSASVSPDSRFSKITPIPLLPGSKHYLRRQYPFFRICSSVHGESERTSSQIDLWQWLFLLLDSARPIRCTVER